jgi:drug/metabolite transporter (DMT)-like permease
MTRRSNMRHTGRRIALVVIETLIGLAAIFGGVALLTGAFNFDQWIPVTWLTGTPFRDYTVPGLLLLIVVGGGMLLAASTIFVRREWAALLSAAMGLVMIGFEAFEVAIIDRYAQAVVPPTVIQQILLSGLGLVIFGLAASLWMTEYRSHSLLTRHAGHI